MNDKQNAKLNMAQRVLETMTRYQAVYSKIAPIAEAVSMLNKSISNIREAQKEQGSVNIPASTLQKREIESQMIQLCVKIANVLYVIGFSTDNKDLITLHGLSENNFYRLNDNSSLALAGNILDFSKKYVDQLKEYGITETESSALSKAIDKFKSLIAKPMDTIGERKQKTTNLAQLFAALDSLFYDKLDKLMVLFKQSEPEFYGEYRTARNIILSVKHKKKEDTGTADAGE